MRSKKVTVAGKEVTVNEQRIGELEQLLEKYGQAIDGLFSVNTAKELKDTVFTLLYDNLPELVPELAKEDVANAYASEIEELINAFIDVNFFGVKRLAGTLFRATSMK